MAQSEIDIRYLWDVMGKGSHTEQQGREAKLSLVSHLRTEPLAGVRYQQALRPCGRLGRQETSSDLVFTQGSVKEEVGGVQLI